MVANATEGFSKYPTMPSSLVFQAAPTAKMMVPFSLSLLTLSALEWMNYPTMNLRRSSSVKTKSK
jgi:hypothetical protein